LAIGSVFFGRAVVIVAPCVRLRGRASASIPSGR
jgi:hypothetical protein